MIVRYEVLDADGMYLEPDGMMSVPEGSDPNAVAYEILSVADNEGHAVRLWLDPDAFSQPRNLGDPDAWLLATGTPWMRRVPLAFSAADAGGDRQVGDAFEATWIAPLTDGTWAFVQRTYYAVDADHFGPAAMERQDEYLNCHRPSAPGDTEINAEYVYTAVGSADEDPEQLASNSFIPEEGEWEKNRSPGCCGEIAG